jgi:hypothetical protein
MFVMGAKKKSDRLIQNVIWGEMVRMVNVEMNP